MTKSHKSQHYVARSYLAAWCDPDTLKGQNPYVWYGSKAGGPLRRKSPANLFEETDFYTLDLPDGTRHLGLEKGLATLESEFCRIRNNVIINRTSLSADDGGWLLAFMAAAHHRTKSHKEHWQRQWGNVLRVADGMKAALDGMTSEELRHHRPLTPLSKSEGPPLTSMT